jgi:hypothetical protein
MTWNLSNTPRENLKSHIMTAEYEFPVFITNTYCELIYTVITYNLTLFVIIIMQIYLTFLITVVEHHW